jgi:RNA polymerase sigma-70 factor, ECF subfamily
MAPCPTSSNLTQSQHHVQALTPAFEWSFTTALPSWWGVWLQLALGTELPPRRGSSNDATPDHPPSQAGTPLPFDRVYVAHFHHVSRWARALGGLDADVEDIAQDVFMVVRRKLDAFEGGSLHAWLYGITRKTVSDYRRRAWFRRLRTGLVRGMDAHEPSSATALERQGIGPAERWEAQRVLGRVLHKMSDVRRTAFILFEIEGYSGEEIAELEQVPLATIYTRLHHARKDFLRFTAEITGDAPEEPPT